MRYDATKYALGIWLMERIEKQNIIQPFDQGLWQGLFCANIAADEEVLCDVPKYERTAFAIDLDTLSPLAVCGKRTGKAVVYGRDHRFRMVEPPTGEADFHPIL